MRTRSLGERIALFEKSDVYPVVTSSFCAGRSPCDVADAVLSGGARVIQIREKEMPDGPYFELLRACRVIADKYGALLIADDRADAALAAGADGVHVGQDDLPCRAVRSIAPDLLIGVSTHNAEEIRRAQEDGCSYLNIGPVFPTGTKSLPMASLGPDMVDLLMKDVHVPFSVMGGIKYGHLPQLRRMGIRHIAAVTAFTAAEDPGSEVSRWREAFLN